MMNDVISRQSVFDIVDDLSHQMTVEGYWSMVERVKALPSAQPELIEQGAYVRGFEQGRTQGMINNTIKAEWTNADALDLQPTCNQLATDCISRQAVTDTVRKIILGFFSEDGAMNDTEKTLLSVSKAVCNGVRALPSAQQEIIRCRKCKFASGDSRICMKFGHSPIGELDFCAWAERRTDDGE